MIDCKTLGVAGGRGAGASLRIEENSSGAVGAANGFAPLTISYRSTPSAQTSVRASVTQQNGNTKDFLAILMKSADVEEIRLAHQVAGASR